MAVNFIDIGLNVQDVVAGAQQFANSLDSSATASINFKTKLEEFDNAGNVVRATVIGLANDGRQYEVSLKNIAGTMTATNVVAKENAKALRDITDAERAFNHETQAFLISGAGIVRLFESQILRTIFRGLISEFEQGVSGARDFSIEIAKLQTVSQDAGYSTQKWADEIRKLSDRFSNPQAEVTQAAYAALTSQIVNATNVVPFLDTALKFSQATLSSSVDSVNLLATALNSFNLPASQADRVASVFFKTVELGRTNVHELSQSFGRIGPLASSLGISLEETAASLTTLTNSGVKFQDATSLITQVVQKLLHPTEDMKKVLNDLGYSSGEAAIQTLGLGGVLKEFDAIAQKTGVGGLEELFGKVRAVRAAVGLTGEAFTKYGEDLQKIKDGSESLARATDLIRNSIGEEFKRELNKIKTFFTDEFGLSIISTLLDITKQFGGIANAAKLLTELIKQAAIAAGVFSIAATIAAIPAGIATLNVYWGTLIGLIYGATTAAKAFQLAMATSVVGAAAAIGALLIYNNTSLSAPDFRQGEQNKLNQYEEDKRNNETANRDKIEAAKRAEDQINSDVDNALKFRLQVVLKYIADVDKLAVDLRNREITYLKQVAEQAKITGKTYTDSIKQAIDAANKQATEAATNIRTSTKVQLDIPNEVGQLILGKKEHYADEYQQIDLLQRKIKQLQAEARSLFDQNTRESVEEARKLYKEIEKDQVDLFTKQTEFQKKIFEHQAQTGQISPNGQDPITGKDRFVFTANTLQLERDLNKTAQERIELEKKFQDLEEQRRQKLLADAEKEKERLRNVQDALKAIADFSITDKSGKVKKDYAGPEGPGKAQADFESLVANLNKFAGPDAVNQQFQFFVDLQKQRVAVAKQTETLIQAEQLETLRQDVINSKKAVEEKRALAEGQQKDAAKIIEESSKNLDVRTDQIAENLKKDSNIFNSINNNLSAVRDSFIVLDYIKKNLETIAQLRREAVNEQDVDKAKQLSKEIEYLTINLDKYIRLRSTPGTYPLPLLQAAGIGGTGNANIDTVAFPGKGATSLTNQGETVRQTLDQFKSQADNLAKALEAQKDSTKQLDDAKAAAIGLNDAVLRIPNALKFAADSGEESRARLSKSFSDIVIDVNRTVDQVIQLNAKLKELSLTIPQVPTTTPAPGNAQGGLPRYYGSGGFVSFEPKGYDTIPAMLDPKEFIVNRTATNKFYTQLTQMNNGFEPSFGQHKSNNVTIGDIHVTVQGGPTSEVSVRKIAEGLRRELRRGTVTLD